MPPIYLADTIALAFKQTESTRPIVNNLHLNASASPFTHADLLTLATAAYEAWESNMLPLQSSALTLDACVATDISGFTGPSAEYTESNAGGDGGTAQALNVACCVSEHTPLRYRGGHGRMYIAGITDPMLFSSTHFTVDAADDFAEALQAIDTALTGNTYGAITVNGVVVLHGRKQVIPHTVPPTYLPPFSSFVQTYSANTRLDSQRRRLGKT